jgi:hypothetical protein
MNETDLKILTDRALEAARLAGGETAFRADVNNWPKELVGKWVDISKDIADDHGLKLAGVRTDSFGFFKIGATQDCVNGGFYNGVPIVMTEVPFDTVELVFRPKV